MGKEADETIPTRRLTLRAQMQILVPQKMTIGEIAQQAAKDFGQLEKPEQTFTLARAGIQLDRASTVEQATQLGENLGPLDLVEIVTSTASVSVRETAETK